MSRLSHSIQNAYGKMLQLYPRRFREEFGDEMKEVFEQVVQDVENHNPWTIIRLFLREVFNLPKVIIQDFLFAHNRGKGELGAHNRSTILLNHGGFMDGKENKWVLSGRKDTIAAVLPPTLFGLGISLTWGIMAGPWYQAGESTRTTAMLVGLIPITIMAGVGIYGLFKKMPAWSPVWYGVDICGFLLLQALADNDPTFFNDPLVLTASILGIAALLIIAISIALRGWEQAGLLGIGLSSTICLFHGHTLSAGPINRADIGILTVLAGGCFSALSYLFIKAEKTWQRVAILAVTAGLNITAVAFTARMYSVEWNGQSFFLPLAVLITVALASGLLVQVAKTSYCNIFTKGQ